MSVRAVTDEQSVGRLLLKLRGFEPKVRTRVRRELRTIGDEAIAEMRGVLDGPLPEGVAVTGQRRSIEYRKKLKRFVVVKRNDYGSVSVKRRGDSTGMREAIKAGIKLRIRAGESKQGIDIATSGPKQNGFNKARFWNARRFRHPVFGRADSYVYQAGQPYIKPAYEARPKIRDRAREILEREIAAMSK